jgi:Cys-tRNA(Pro)/Cys-tRNA(Cys) deacylase
VTHKTNAARLLDRLAVRYELREYAVDSENLDAESVAGKIGLPPRQVFKTLVVRGDRNGICMAVIPGDAELDLKALASASGDRKLQLIAHCGERAAGTYWLSSRRSHRVGAKKTYPVYVDDSIKLFDRISVSAGIRGMQVLIAPSDYVKATDAMLAPLAHKE